MLVGEDDELDSIILVTEFNKVVTNTAIELLSYQRRNKKPWVTDEILDCCDKRRGELEGAKIIERSTTKRSGKAR